MSPSHPQDASRLGTARRSGIPLQMQPLSRPMRYAAQASLISRYWRLIFFLIVTALTIHFTISICFPPAKHTHPASLW